MKYDFKNCDDVCASVKNEMNDEVVEVDLEIDLKVDERIALIDLKITVVHVFNEIAREINDEVAFNVKADFDVTASLVNELLKNVSML